VDGFSFLEQPMWTLKPMASISAFGLLLGCTFTVGCGFRAISDRDVIGTYEANAQWGESTLVLRPDHSFEQTVLRNDDTKASTKGRK
jgi:hypothetical protein